MDQKTEIKICKAAKALRERIRDLLLMPAVAVKYHVNKAERFFKDREELEHNVWLEGDAQAKYLGQLPALIAETREQNEKCAQLWESAQRSKSTGKYVAERAHLIVLLQKFQYTLSGYERLARHPEKSRVEHARSLIARDEETTNEAREIETEVRMTLRQYVKSEDEIDQCLREIDEVRNELIEAHREWAVEFAAKIKDEAAQVAALYGLSKAANAYDVDRGYRFQTYAQWWIKDAIKKRDKRIVALPMPVPKILNRASIAIQNHVLPCVRIERTKAAECAIGSSKLCGQPDLPANFNWPVSNRRKLNFLLQIRLRDLAEFPFTDLLTADGLLSFFYDMKEQPWGSDPENLDGFRVHYFSKKEKLQRFQNSRANQISKQFSLHFCEGRTIPRQRSRSFKKVHRTSPIVAEMRAAYDKFANAVGNFGKSNPEAPNHQILGHSVNIQGDMQLEAQLVTNGIYCGDGSGYRLPEAGQLEGGADDWILLLQLDSDPDAGFMWGDCGMLYFWIRKDDLKNRRFDKVWATIQCY